VEERERNVTEKGRGKKDELGKGKINFPGR
jgi:hypothetical protein